MGRSKVKSRAQFVHVDITDKHIESLAKILYEKTKDEKRAKQYASVKTILYLLGMGITIASIFVAPKSTYMLAKHMRKDEEEWGAWKKFNQTYLRQTLRRLAKQKLVEIKEVAGKQQIIITSQGKKRIVLYAREELEIKKPKSWDKKWRIVIYDIPQREKKLQQVIREALKNLGFLLMQESVYIIPYPCYKEVEFLREYYGVGTYLKYLVAEKLEDDVPYRTYFDLK